MLAEHSTHTFILYMHQVIRIIVPDIVLALTEIQWRQ